MTDPIAPRETGETTEDRLYRWLSRLGILRLIRWFKQKPS